uniref:Uncharacterized protein n=1 Tax=Compsopogon caeruleus TaxID=31354 RepID=A0A7S1XC68_9RHOD
MVWLRMIWIGPNEGRSTSSIIHLMVLEFECFGDQTSSKLSCSGTLHDRNTFIGRSPHDDFGSIHSSLVVAMPYYVTNKFISREDRFEQLTRRATIIRYNLTLGSVLCTSVDG